jgi:hypothetical protein
MPKNIKAACRAIALGAGGAVVLWKLWESLCVINGWNVLGRQLCYAIPVLLVGCGIAWALHRKSERDMSRLFTDQERRELTAIVQSYGQAKGRKIGLCLAPVCVLCGFLYAFCGRSLLLAFLPLVLVLLISLPFSWREGMRQRRKLQQLLSELKSAGEAQKRDDQE